MATNLKDAKRTPEKKTQATTEAAPEPAGEAAAGLIAIAMELPLAPEKHGVYVPLHFDIRLSHDAAVFLKRLLGGLAAVNAKLANGSPVDPNKPISALRWLIEEAQRQAKAEEGK